MGQSPNGLFKIPTQLTTFHKGTYARHLHSIVSTGAVLTPALAQWLVEAFGPMCQISMSGGTELCGAFLHGTRSLPSYPGEMSVKSLGMDIVVFSADGRELPNAGSGELVCRIPFPNMPAMFWNDPKRERYFKSYFSHFPRELNFRRPFQVRNQIRS